MENRSRHRMKCNTVGFLQTLLICLYIVFNKHTRSIFGELTLKILEIVVAHHGHFSFFYKNKMASLKYRKFKILPTYFSGKLRNKSYFIKSDHNQISVLLFIVHMKVYVHPRVDETIQVCISWNTFGRKQIYNIY